MMNMLLITVTGFSLLMAIAMGVLLARVLRDERRRSEARVALLTELAADAPNPADHVPLRSSATPHADIFDAAPEVSAWPKRVAVMGGLAIFLTFAALGWRALVPTAEVAARQTPAAQSGAKPLELLSLRHLTANGSLTITGLVQNPPSGASLERIEATVLAFDAGGAMIASGRAPLDYLKLAPGDESPFVIRVPVDAAVARYRIGFRAADGSVLSHVDRRDAASIARKQDP